MSAIFGVLRFDGGPVAQTDLERMGRILTHHAPHGRKAVATGPVGLGHCLTRVNREDRFEVQPVLGDDGSILVADARLDNREALSERFGIPPAELRELPDSALILRAYNQWGADCAQHLVGDFAFALWDARAQRLLLCRDHMGQRAVHWHRGPDFLVFATEIKALWALEGVPRKLNMAHVGRYMMWELRPRGSQSAFEGIAGIPGGSTLSVSIDGTISRQRYWEPRAAPEHVGRDEAHYIAAYRTVLAEAVACRVRRLIDPPALCHGGGFDSSAIAGLAGPALAGKGHRLIAVSCVMPEDYDGPLRHPRRWVDLCRRDMPHLDVRYFVRRDETIFTRIETLFHAADYPLRGPNFLHDALFREAAGAGARLIMDGNGGDDTLNPRGNGVLAHLMRTGRWARFAREFAAHRRVTGRGLIDTLKREVVYPLLPESIRRWLALRKLDRSAPFAEFPIAPEFADSLFRHGEADRHEIGAAIVLPWLRKRSLHALRRGIEWPRRRLTNEAAIHGLSMTRPFMDKRVVELGLAIPEHLYVAGGRNRYLARRALAGVYPAEFQTRDAVADPLLPDQLEMLEALQPELREQAAQLAGDAALAQHVDFARLDGIFDPSQPEPPSGALLIRASRAVLAARYVKWFERRNC
ncbi:MAG: hypothetical protein JSR60_08210 [Proteobacteria bacterium]|nr:hypothetical protein [Pseudomonadota bacterium]